MFARLLEKQCIEDFQIGYNVVCTLWVISYHEFALPYFQDQLDFGGEKCTIIEKVAKILDFFNKEKIVRIVLMLFDVNF